MDMISRLISTLVIILIFGSQDIYGQTGEALDHKPVALMNGVAHLGNGDTIENAVITFAEGIITLVADARLVRLDLSGYEIMDISGKHVYLIRDFSRTKKQKCFKIIADTQSRQLTENESANLLVSACKVDSSGNSVTYVFVDGEKQPDNHFFIEENRLKVK